uniref:ladderlectin-like n=1 Tax=Semicossyphus pulcher TaxID=241346 RepID=UPI0037E84268
MKFLTVTLLVCALMVLSEADPGPEPEPESEKASEIQEGETDLFKRATTCPSGWTAGNDRCFLYISSYKTWAQAERYCQSYGGNLASVHSASDYHFIQWVITTATYKHAETWLGASDAQEEGTWLWSDGSLYNYKHTGTFDNAGGKQHCLQMNHGVHKLWDDIACSTLLPSICSKKP